MKNRILLGVVAGFVFVGVGCGSTASTARPIAVPIVPVPAPIVNEPAAAPSASAPADKVKPVVEAKKSVEISGFAFSPADLQIKIGTTVIWTNQDSAPHTVTSDDGTFTSQKLSKGEVYSFTFAKAGTFAYHCQFHPSMRATITVN